MQTAAFLLAKATKRTFNVDAVVRFGALDNAPYDVRLDPETHHAYQQTYAHALGEEAVSDLIEKYYRGMFDSLADATGVDYEVETYSAQQADPVFRHEFLATLGYLESIRWPLAPSHGQVHLRLPARSADGPRNAPNAPTCYAPAQAAQTSPPYAPTTATTR